MPNPSNNPSSAERRLTVCLTFDFDAMSSWIGSFKTKSLPAISRGEFGAHAVPRILRLLDDAQVPATFFVPGHTAMAFPDAVRAIHAGGHEIGHHGWVHENPSDLDQDEEREVLEKGFAVLAEVTSVVPRGYRSPSCDFSGSTLDLLAEFDFLYDSSCSASDFSPYYLRRGDRFSRSSAYVFGPLTELVEMPFSWILDDFPHFEFVEGVGTAQSTPAQVREIWEGEFEYAYENEPGGCFVLCMHPQMIGRGGRLRMLAELVTEMKSRDGVRFATMTEHAEAWRQRNPLEEWAKANPWRTGRSSLSEG